DGIAIVDDVLEGGQLEALVVGEQRLHQVHAEGFPVRRRKIGRGRVRRDVIGGWRGQGGGGESNAGEQRNEQNGRAFHEEARGDPVGTTFGEPYVPTFCRIREPGGKPPEPWGGSGEALRRRGELQRSREGGAAKRSSRLALKCNSYRCRIG